jgi:magnesium-transporting ATPase (P-type)
MKKNFNQTASLLTYSARSVDVVAQEFGANTTGGLTTQRAQTLLTQEGRNEIQHRRTRATEILRRQLASPFIYLLFAAALLSIGLREVLEGSMILLFIAINTGIGFFQEYQSEKILTALSHFVAQRAKVIRNGEITIIDAAVVVPGDTIGL